MSDLEKKMLHSLDVMAAARPLVQLIDDVLDTYPDPYLLASDHATAILHERTGRVVDPRRVWWHLFGTASSSSRSFTGWQHNGTPIESIRLTELVARRFDPAFQDASDELDLYGGFYRADAYAGVYDEHNEVQVLAQDIRLDLWALDFAEVYKKRG